MTKIVQAMAMMMVMAPALASAAPAVKVGDYGAWELDCDNNPDTGCIASSSVVLGRIAATVLIGAIAPRRIGVVVDDKNFLVTGQVDDGPPSAGQCDGDLCLFTELAFEAAWARGTVLTIRIAEPGKPPVAFERDLVSMRAALAAANDWLKAHPRK